MPLPTLEQFKAQTKLDDSGHFFTSHRGSSIRKIDTKLKLYWKLKHPMEKMAALSSLLGECAAWLKEKSGKESPSTKRRRLAIAQVSESAFLLLRDSFGVVSGEDRFNYNKSKNVGKFEGGLKSLHGGYALERQGYLESKSNPLSSSSIANKSAKPDLRLDRHRIAEIVKGDQRQKELLLHLLDPHTDWHTLTLEQAKILALVCKHFDHGEVDKVEFLHKKARVKYLVTYKGKRHDFEDSVGKPFDTASGGHGRFMYTVDEYGNLLASKEGLGGLNMWNHSGYNAGKDVLCAGMIEVKKGKLTYIDTLSGHYKPRREHLQRVLILFREEGIDLSTTEVGATVGAGKNPGHSRVDFMSATQLLENVNALGMQREVLNN